MTSLLDMAEKWNGSAKVVFLFVVAVSVGVVVVIVVVVVTVVPVCSRYGGRVGDCKRSAAGAKRELGAGLWSQR